MQSSSLIAQEVGYVRGERAVLANVSLELRPGRWLALVGPNGSGKSTLLRLLAGIEAPHSGAVLLDGRPLARIGPRLRGRRLAYLPQQAPFPEAMSALEVVRLGRTPHVGLWGRLRAADHDAVAWALHVTGSARFAALELGVLSGGERQRVLVARALATRPQYLLLDEPTIFLDLRHQAALLAIMARLRDEGVGVLTVLHDLNQALHADDIAVLDGGRVAGCGPAASVLRPDLLRRVYGGEVTLRRTDRGELVVLPRAGAGDKRAGGTVLRWMHPKPRIRPPTAARNPLDSIENEDEVQH